MYFAAAHAPQTPVVFAADAPRDADRPWCDSEKNQEQQVHNCGLTVGGDGCVFLSQSLASMVFRLGLMVPTTTSEPGDT